MIDIRNLFVTLSGKEILREISFKVASHDRIAVVGASGEGKSVLVRTILGLIRPDSGSVYMNDINVHQATEAELSLLRQKIGVLFQGSALFDFMDVEENVGFPLTAHENLSPKEKRARVNECLEMVGLAGTNKKMPDELSGGMQKRVALARAIIRKPEFMFYDEPTSGLDPVRARAINEMIGWLNKTLGLTSITVTHDMEALEKVANRVMFLQHGKIAFFGRTDEMESNKPLMDFIEGKG